jgi:hypothetical protein
MSFTCNVFGQVKMQDEKDGFIVVNSAPEGAKVYIDNEYMGDTPLIIRRNFQNLKFILTLKHSDYPKYEETFSKVRNGSELFVILDGNYGILNISTEPSGAKIKINDQEYGRTPISSIKLPLGLNRIELEKENYTSLSKTVYLNKTRQSVNFKMDYQFSFVSFYETDSKGKNTDISIDGKRVPDALAGEKKIDSGERDILISSDAFYKEIRENFNFEPAKKYSMSIDYDKRTLKYVLLSAAFPGLGQFFNGSKIKGSILGAAALTSIYMIISSQINYKDNLNEYHRNLTMYRRSLYEDEVVFRRALLVENEAGANKYLKNRNYFIAGFAAIYLLNILDAVLFHTRDYSIKILEKNDTVQLGGNFINIKLRF